MREDFFEDEMDDIYPDDYDDGRIKLEDPEQYDIPLDDEDDFEFELVSSNPQQKIKSQIDNIKNENDRKRMKIKRIGSKEIIEFVPIHLIDNTKCVIKNLATGKLEMLKFDDVMFID